SSASGQAPGSQRVSPEKEVNATRAGQPGNSENGVATPLSRTSDLESDVAAMKADNAAVREQLRKMEEQQKALLDLVDRLQRRLDSPTAVRGAVGPVTTPPSTQATESSQPSTSPSEASPISGPVQTVPK